MCLNVQLCTQELEIRKKNSNLRIKFHIGPQSKAYEGNSYIDYGNIEHAREQRVQFQCISAMVIKEISSLGPTPFSCKWELKATNLAPACSYLGLKSHVTRTLPEIHV